MMTLSENRYRGRQRAPAIVRVALVALALMSLWPVCRTAGANGPAAAFPDRCVTVFWTDKGINNYQYYQDKRDLNYGTEFDSIFAIPEAGKILVLMPYDQDLPTTPAAREALRAEIQAQLMRRMREGLAQGVRDFEVRTVQMIGTLGYFEAWDQQPKVKEFTGLFLEALQEVKTQLQKRYQVTCTAAVGSNGAYVATENIPELARRGRNPIDSLSLFDGRAYVSQTQATIDALQGRVSIINTAGDAPASGQMIGNHDATKRLKEQNPAIHAYWLDPAGWNLFIAGHLKGTDRQRNMWVKEYDGGQFSRPTQMSAGDFIDNHLVSQKGLMAQAQPGDLVVRHGKGILGPPVTGGLLDDIPHVGLYVGEQHTSSVVELRVEQVAGKACGMIREAEWDNVSRFKNPGFFSVLDSTIPVRYRGRQTTLAELPEEVKQGIRDRVCATAVGDVGRNYGEYQAPPKSGRTNHCGDWAIEAYDKALQDMEIQVLRYEGLGAIGRNEETLTDGTLRDWLSVGSWQDLTQAWMDPSKINDRFPRVTPPVRMDSAGVRTDGEGGVLMRMRIDDSSFKKSESGALEEFRQQTLKTRGANDDATED